MHSQIPAYTEHFTQSGYIIWCHYDTVIYYIKLLIIAVRKLPHYFIFNFAASFVVRMYRIKCTKRNFRRCETNLNFFLFPTQNIVEKSDSWNEFRVLTRVWFYLQNLVPLKSLWWFFIIFTVSSIIHLQIEDWKWVSATE